MGLDPLRVAAQCADIINYIHQRQLCARSQPRYAANFIKNLQAYASTMFDGKAEILQAGTNLAEHVDQKRLEELRCVLGPLLDGHQDQKPRQQASCVPCMSCASVYVCVCVCDVCACVYVCVCICERVPA